MKICVMKSRIEVQIEQILNQEFLSEVETRQNEDSDSDEEMTSETEDTDDDSEPNMKMFTTIWTLQVWQ